MLQATTAARTSEQLAFVARAENILAYMHVLEQSTTARTNIRATRKCAFGGNSRSPKGAAEEVALHLRRSKQQASFTTAPACTARCICNAFVITCMSCEASSRNRLKSLHHCKLHRHCSMYTASFVYHPSMKTHTNYSRTWSGPLQYYTHIVVWCYNQHLKC